MSTPREYCRELNHAYERLHTAKEDAFWTAYMGLADDADAARADLGEREKELQAFLQDPRRLAAVREQLARAGDGDARVALEGWERTLSAHAIDSEAGRALAAEIVDAEGRLARARSDMKLGYRVDGGDYVEANSVRLGTMLLTERDEATRKAAWQALRSIEDFVVENGFVEVVRMRNRLGRMMGGEDFYDWRVRRVEGLSKRRIFDRLDDLEEQTRAASGRGLDLLRAEKGEAGVAPWNVRHFTDGDIEAELDPFFPFAQSFERWGRTFAGLGIDYNGAEMVLDLVDRKGKYPNGFMHGPAPAWRDEGAYRPARVQFTANAIPGMVGSGKRATETLFHEGGHAAHFANIDMPAPCFAQEFAPTSVAFAEVQSMFCDSLLADPDWRARYARTAGGEPMPLDLIERAIELLQPYAALTLRLSFTVPYCERAIYEIPDDELSAERILDEIAAVERRLLGMERSSRPALSIPHLLAGESSAYYHGYILAQMGVEQTREFFLERDGHLVDNPRIGPDLREIYWRPGNSKGFLEFMRSMTGGELTADALARRVNRGADEAVAEARDRAARLAEIPAPEGRIELGARIRIVHGHQTVAECTGEGGFNAASEAFADWIRAFG